MAEGFQAQGIEQDIWA